jgi:hypothetical protein
MNLDEFSKSSDPAGNQQTIIAIDGYSPVERHFRQTGKRVSRICISTAGLCTGPLPYCLDQGIITGGVIDIPVFLKNSTD